MPAYFDMGAGYQEGAWHGDMIVFNEHLTVSQAIEVAGMNFNYELHPAYSEFPIRDADGNVIDVHKIAVPKRFDLWREPIPSDPTPRLVRSGIGNRYKLLQHSDMANYLDPISEIYPTETVAVVKDWQITFMTLRMEDYEVGGFEQELTRTYLHLSDDRGTPGSAFWGIMSQREACYNTYLMAMSTARELHRISHGGDMNREISFRRDLVLHAQKGRREQLAQLDAMIKHTLEENELESIIAAAFPFKGETRNLELARIIPVGATTDAFVATQAAADKDQEWLDKRNETIEGLRGEVRTNFSIFNDEYSYAANTVYAAFQSLTYTVNHSDVYRGNETKQRINLLIGERGEAMDRGYSQALACIAK